MPTTALLQHHRFLKLIPPKRLDWHRSEHSDEPLYTANHRPINIRQWWAMPTLPGYLAIRCAPDGPQLASLKQSLAHWQLKYNISPAPGRHKVRPTGSVIRF